MCINHKCQSIPVISGPCKNGCGGHGVCNSLGNCHCDQGYQPPDCSSTGYGGSIDSGHASNPAGIIVKPPSRFIQIFNLLIYLLFSYI